MKDLRVEKQKYDNKKQVWKLKLYVFWSKRKWWIISSIIAATIIFFPTESGQAIGQWFHDFVGNISKYSKF